MAGVRTASIRTGRTDYPVYDNTGSARLQVTPRNTQVYVDGYFVGVVDNFDGTLQRLNVEAGEHELQLYLEGYRPFTQKVLFPRGGTLRITHAMEPLAPGESAGAPPKPDPRARRQQPDPGMRMQPEYRKSESSGAAAATAGSAVRLRIAAASSPSGRRDHSRRWGSVDRARGPGPVRDRAVGRAAPD